MQKFELYLKNQRTKFYKRFAGFLLGLNFIALWFVLTKQDYTRSEGKLVGIAGIILMVLTFIVQYILIFNKKDDHSGKSLLSISICIILFLTFTGYWWIGLIVLVLFSLYRVSDRELKITILQASIFYPSFPVKKISWTSLNNCLLRDGLLTIDFRNNRIIQQAIDESKTSVNEKEFNEFCKEQIRKVSSSV